MNISVYQYTLFGTILCAAASHCPWLFADIYNVSPDSLNWQQEEKKFFYCQLEQSIPLFGVLAIKAAAGHQLTIELRSSLFPQLPKNIQLQLVPIPWGASSNGAPPRENAAIPIASYELLSNVNSEGIVLKLPIPARQFLQELNSHSQLRLVAISGENRNRNMVEVIIPTLGIRPTLTAVSECILSLLPRNYDELKQYNLYFATGQKELGPTQRQWLLDTVRYLAADESIIGITIDGHSDGTPFKQLNQTLSRLKNLELSENRALNVGNQLKKYIQEANTIRPLTITVRHHGQRYPVADNRTAEGRSLNRRVEVSLKREVSDHSAVSMASKNG